MKRCITLAVALLFIVPLHAQRYWISDTPGDWSDSNNWATASNGTGPASPPGASDRAFFDSFGTGNCRLDIAPSVSAIIISSGYPGTIDLNGNNLTIGNGGNSTFGDGVISNSGVAAFININASSNSVIFSGTQFGERISIAAVIRGLNLNGSVFGVASGANGTCSFQATDGTVSTSSGNNTFNMPVTFALTSSSLTYSWTLSNTSADVFNSNVTVTLTGTATRAPIIRFANGADCTFNGNVTLSSNYLANIANVGGIYFGNGDNVAGTPSSGGISTFTNGTLSTSGTFNGRIRIERFLQTGNASTTLALSNAGSSELIIGACEFNGNFSASSGKLFVTNSKFFGSANDFTLSSLSSHDGHVGGGNIFGSPGAASTTRFEVAVASATRYFIVGEQTLSSPGSRITGSGADTYNGDVIFEHSGGGASANIRPAYSSASQYFGDITWENNSTSAPIIFGQAGGSVRFSGSADQGINRVSGTATFAGSWSLEKTDAGAVRLNTPVNASGVINFSNGDIISTSSADVLTIQQAPTGASDLSHVNGYVSKVCGAISFDFPVGDGTVYKPLTVSAGDGATEFIAHYVPSTAHAVSSNLASPLKFLNGCEHWTLARVGSGSIRATLSWDNSSIPCDVVITDIDHLLVAQYDGTAWQSRGVTSVSGVNAAGFITSGDLNNFSSIELALGSNHLDSPLPVVLVNFTARPERSAVALMWETTSEMNNWYFEVQRSRDGVRFDSVGTVMGAGWSAEVAPYEFTDYWPLQGRSYYRLKQYDYDRRATFSQIVFVSVEKPAELVAFPNPAYDGIVRLPYESNFSVFNAQGKLIHRIANTRELDVTSFDAGIHTVVDEVNNYQIRISIR